MKSILRVKKSGIIVLQECCCKIGLNKLFLKSFDFKILLNNYQIKSWTKSKYSGISRPDVREEGRNGTGETCHRKSHDFPCVLLFDVYV